MNKDELYLKNLMTAALPEFADYILGCSIDDLKQKEKSITVVLALKRSAEVEAEIQKFILRLDDNFSSIHFVFEQKAMLTKMAILRVIKSIQPATVENIKSYLIKQKFFISEKTLKNNLDELRKDSWLVWGNHYYCLTEAALRLLPHGNYRESSDISRALEFRDKKW